MTSVIVLDVKHFIPLGTFQKNLNISRDFFYKATTLFVHYYDTTKAATLQNLLLFQSFFGLEAVTRRQDCPNAMLWLSNKQQFPK